ncbi:MULTISPECIES: hypothetical protein [unclassified Crossiella]|uniref:hypothetical protein n=1 Tax=unclassified Crossiella TaxID=2620835 RepID=UPI0020000DD5|nr:MULTISPECIES: hypothetical protein [unclassified Crossiella]MCK2239788.1 hypothetical protein [Crossiella sp. S99.2]MCK2252483.1 hypothetical protein [Crossiella sp. S99.1]
MAGPFCLVGDLWYVVRREPDFDLHLIGILDQPHGEPDGLEQAPEVLFGCIGEVELEIGQSVKESDVVHTGCVGFALIGSVEVGHRRQRCLLLGCQFVVGGAQALSEGVVGVAFLRLTQDGGLAAGEIGEDPL